MKNILNNDVKSPSSIYKVSEIFKKENDKKKTNNNNNNSTINRSEEKMQ